MALLGSHAGRLGPTFRLRPNIACLKQRNNAMYEKLCAPQSCQHTNTSGGMSIPQACQHTYPFGEALSGAGSHLLKTELGACGERILDSGSAYMQTNIGRYFSNPHYYFQVNDEYVKNKLKVILFPFLHRGHWMRTNEASGGEFSFKPPIYDINAPDLYIPLMAFGTYLVLAGFVLGINGKFSPEALGMQFSDGLLGWFLEVLLLEATLHSLGGGDVPILDVVAYGGYTFTPLSVVLLAKIVSSYCFYAVTLWECFCTGVFLVKTIKRILIAEVTSYEKNSSKRNYLLLLVAMTQMPLLFWLGNIRV